ncbi:hypothetical protein AB9E06_06020 [Rhizobium leguminosarum]|uniref:hypothetical protein n=1 Tax=Rhizobium leguminosarum TaxID=384 RepID=UPI003F947CF3
MLTNKRITWLENTLTDAVFVELMEALAAKVVQRLCRHTPLASAFHIIASVEDFELLALPVIKELEKLGHSGVWSCVWPDRQNIGVDRSTMIAPIVVSVDEAPLDAAKDLVLVSSCVDTTAVLESMLTYAHSSPKLAYSRISIIAPFFAEGARQEFRQALPRRNAETYTWLGLFQVPPDAAFRLKNLFVQKTTLALGVETPDSLRRHMPAKILRRFDEKPKSTPGLSM